MTRIYFKPQGAPSRAGFNRTRKHHCSGSTPAQQHDHHHRKGSHGTEEAQKTDEIGWRSKLEPNAIEQIADGLEKMVLSWTNQPQKLPHSDPDFTFLHDDSHNMLSSDAIKAATMEFVDEGEQFSIGAKETTISVVHHHEQHRNHQGLKPAPMPPHQQTLIVDTSGDPDGFMQDIMKGDILKNGLLSIQNGDSAVADYQQTNRNVGTPSALWYLTPTLALPNTLNYTKEYGSAQQKSGSFQDFGRFDGEEDGYHIAQHELMQHNGDGHKKFSKGRTEQNEIMSNGNSVLHEEKPQRGITASEKIPCKLEALGSKIWNETVEINGGTKIKDLLGRKLVAMGNGFPSAQGSRNSDSDYYKKKVEELQIALLECAMEYEVKIFVLLYAMICSELVRKEQEIVDCRLREKEAKAQLYELQLCLQKAQASQIEPRKLLTLLPALKDWIQTTKKISHDVANHEKVDNAPQIDSIVHAITKEIRMLQTALSHVIQKY